MSARTKKSRRAPARRKNPEMVRLSANHKPRPAVRKWLRSFLIDSLF